jgi:hypothetical protein
MNNHKKELIEKIYHMSLDELISYEASAKNTNRFINLLGISIIWMMLIFTNVFTLIAGSIVVYVMSNLGVGINDTIRILREQIEKHQS